MFGTVFAICKAQLLFRKNDPGREKNGENWWKYVANVVPLPILLTAQSHREEDYGVRRNTARVSSSLFYNNYKQTVVNR